MNKFVFIVIGCLTILFFSGCGFTPKVLLKYDAKIPEAIYLSEDLEQNLLEYWALKSNGEIDKLYAMEAPYIRELTPLSIYKKIFTDMPPLEKLEILNVRADSNLYYEITLMLYYEKKSGEMFPPVVIDKWVKVNGEWAHVIKDPVFKNYFP